MRYFIFVIPFIKSLATQQLLGEIETDFLFIPTCKLGIRQIFAFDAMDC
jgi:hypothetical protein